MKTYFNDQKLGKIANNIGEQATLPKLQFFKSVQSCDNKCNEKSAANFAHELYY